MKDGDSFLQCYRALSLSLSEKSCYFKECDKILETSVLKPSIANLRIEGRASAIRIFVIITMKNCLLYMTLRSPVTPKIGFFFGFETMHFPYLRGFYIFLDIRKEKDKSLR